MRLLISITKQGISSAYKVNEDESLLTIAKCAGGVSQQSGGAEDLDYVHWNH